MRSNGLLKWLMIPVAILVLFVGIRLFSGGGSTAPPAADNGAQLTPEEMKALGIEGDTPRDTVATLVAQVKQLRTELQTALSDNKSQREENQRLRQRENSIDQRINSALESERSNLRRDQEQAASARQQTEGLLADLQRRLDSIGGRGGGHADLPVGLGLQGGDEAGMEGGVRWVEPDDAKPAEGRNAGRGASGGMSFPTSFGPAQSTLETTAETVANAGAQVAGVKTAKPVYTVPTNSTLMGSVAMTALIGRVPIDGTVNDPYPFKVLVGPDNLTANGIDIPDVAGAVFSGTASGDWTLSCVRGQVRSITFVFNDGTIRTIPEDREGNQQNNQQRDGLGWISDPARHPLRQRRAAQQRPAVLRLAGPDHGGRCRRGLAHRERQRPHVVCRLGRLHRHRGHQRPGGGRPDSGGRRAGHVGLGQQALRPSVRRRLCPARREGRRPPRKAARHRLRSRRPQGRSPHRRKPCSRT
jgi:integrating conjugative element protein (TIGR03752 family)